MPRCGCTGTCSCLVVAGEGIVVEGIGSVENPYQISSDAADLVSRVTFTDTATIDFTASGAGSGAHPMVVSAAAKVAMSELTDVQGTPANSQVLVWSTDHWEPQNQSGSGGGPGVPPGGTTGQVLSKLDNTDGNANWMDVPKELPIGGAIGQVLTKQTAADGSVYWTTPASGGGGGTTERSYAAVRRTAVATSFADGVAKVVPFEIVEVDDGIPWDAVNNWYTIPVTGYYSVYAIVNWTAGNTGYRALRILRNGVEFAASVGGAASSGGISASVSRVCLLTAGDKIHITGVQGSGAAQVLTTASTFNYFTISKIPTVFAQSVALGERVYAGMRAQQAATSLPSATVTAIPWDTAIYDDGITWNGVDGFTAPVAGHYDVEALVTFSAVNTTGVRTAMITLNGSSQASAATTPSASQINSTTVSAVVKCAAGDVIRVMAYQTSGGTLTLSGNSQYTRVSIAKVPAPAVAGSAASGVWGVAPLDVYGSDTLVGNLIYVDSNGQLRSQPRRKTCSGRVVVTVTSATTGTAVVTFPAGLFTTPPRVVAMNIGASVWMAYASAAPSTSGFTVGVRHVDNVTGSASVNVDWIATEDG